MTRREIIDYDDAGRVARLHCCAIDYSQPTAEAREDITFESGAKLAKGTTVYVFSTVPATPDDVGAVGIEWHDDEGDHAAAIAADKLTLALRSSR